MYGNNYINKNEDNVDDSSYSNINNDNNILSTAQDQYKGKAFRTSGYNKQLQMQRNFLSIIAVPSVNAS